METLIPDPPRSVPDVHAPLTIDLSTVQLSEDQFYQLCRQNETLRFEMTAQGELLVMAPVGGESGRREADLITDLQLWNRQSQLGFVFSSSTIFRFAHGAKRSPDVAWIEQSRWNALSPAERETFPPIAPDFVIELRSRTDVLSILRDKMQEYVTNGVRLGWLINPQDQQVEIYEPNQPISLISLPAQLSGGAVLPGFSLYLSQF
jgi:Uma2 family endonuclease